MNTPTLAGFILYLAGILIIGTVAYRATRNLSDYLLGGRRLGAAVAALSAGASDMSGWLLLGLPGAVYAGGLKEGWIIIGLLAGAYLNWRFVARALRLYTVAANNALTLSDFLVRRFRDDGKWLRLISALIILVFFTFYSASGLVAGAKLFSSSFDLSYHAALWIGAVVIIGYTFVGGFLAVSWTDLLQGIMMLLALVMVPLVVFATLGGGTATFSAIRQVDPAYLNLFHDFTLTGLFSLLAWGLGYFGQPHILARFMAIRSADAVPKARKIGMSWMFLSLIAAILIGLTGIAYFAKMSPSGKLGGSAETVFIQLTQLLFNPWIAGVLLAAILAAVMSTIDSQLIVCSSALTEDLYKGFLRPLASDKELVWMGRLTVLFIASVAMAIAYNPQSLVLSLVSYAWGGLGASFGPVIILSLFWSRMTRNGALAGIITGSLTVVVWKEMQGGIFDVYELLPGFVFAGLAVFIFSWFDKPPASEILKEFAEVHEKIRG